MHFLSNLDIYIYMYILVGWGKSTLPNDIYASEISFILIFYIVLLPYVSA